MNQPWVYMCPSILKLPYLSPHPLPLGYPRAPPLSALFHASNLHWSSILQSFVFTLVLTSYVCCITCTGLLTECFSLNQKFIFDSWMEMSNKPNLTPYVKISPFFPQHYELLINTFHLKSIKVSPPKINIDLNYYKINLQYSLCL